MEASSKGISVRTEDHRKTGEMDKQETTRVWIQAHLSPGVWYGMV